jgi:hypothetical protein
MILGYYKMSPRVIHAYSDAMKKDGQLLEKLKAHDPEEYQFVNRFFDECMRLTADDT